MKETSLINHNYETIIDLLNTEFTTADNIIETRNKIIELLYETFNINDKVLENSFNIISRELPDELKTYNSYSDISNNINKLCYSLLNNDEFSDHGYTMILLYFFWLTKDVKGGE